MHREQLIFERDLINHLMQHQGTYIPVGTTAMRALESLYWAGVWLIENQSIPADGLVIPKEYAYYERDDIEKMWHCRLF